MKVTGVIYPSIKGVWTVDVYYDYSEDATPDSFLTSKMGERYIRDKAESMYPDINFVWGITGICVECREEHFELEDVCNECGMEVFDG